MTEPFGAGCASVPKTGKGSFDGMPQDPVATAASNNPALSTLVTAVKAAGLVDTLNTTEDLTVFAPTDDAFVTAVLAGLEGSDKPYVHTSGVWIFGNGSAITETSPFDPPALTSWRLPVEARVRSAVGVKTSIVAPGIVFGNGGGIP